MSLWIVDTAEELGTHPCREHGKLYIQCATVQKPRQSCGKALMMDGLGSPFRQRHRPRRV